MKLKPLSEQVIVITVASSGIGLATAQTRAARGAKLVLVARSEDALEAVAARLGAVAVIADIADADTPDRIAEAALQAYGRVDTWVNNAAAALYAKHVETTEAEHRRVFDVGYFGTVRGSLRAVELLRERGGALINTGSVLSERAIPMQGTYSAMKHAVRGFTDSLRMELEEEGLPISVTLIKPNGLDTPYSEHARNKMDKPATVPPITYDPRLAAEAILFAAENPKRELTVGGNGLMVSKLGNAFPGLMDKAMEAIGIQAQQTDQRPPAGVNDNLFQGRANGRIDSDQDGYVRRTSLWLQAQMHPVAATAIISAAVAGLALAISPPRRGGDQRRAPQPSRGRTATGQRTVAAYNEATRETPGNVGPVTRYPTSGPAVLAADAGRADAFDDAIVPAGQL